MIFKPTQVEDIGLYRPEELVFRDGSKVLAVYRNTTDKYWYYSVLYMAGNLHHTITCNKSGRQYKTNTSDKDVFLRYQLPVAVSKVTTQTNMTQQQEFDIGHYKPEQLILRNGAPIVAVFKNDKPDVAALAYTVVYYEMSQHCSVSISKNGCKYHRGPDSSYDVILKPDKSKELLLEAWELFQNVKNDKHPDYYEGLHLSIYRDSSGEVTKGFSGEKEELFSFTDLYELVDELKDLHTYHE